MQIHLLELDKWSLKCDDLNDEDKWLYFFKDGKNWTELPAILGTPEMRQSMSVLKSFSESEKILSL